MMTWRWISLFPMVMVPLATTSCGSSTPGLACAADGWCQVLEVQDASPHALWGFSPSDIWAVGEQGWVMHYDGHAWANVPTRSTDSLRYIWGASSSDLWIAGATSILHWNGVAFEPVTPDTPDKVLGPLWGFGPNDVWSAVTEEGLVHWDGKQWTLVSPAPTGSGEFSSIWGTSGSDLWIADNIPEVFHFDSSNWTKTSVPAGSAGLVSGTGPADIWAADTWASHWNGTAWSQVDTNGMAGFETVFARGPADVWFGGDNEEAGHWDGSGFTSVPVPAVTGANQHPVVYGVVSIWSSGQDDVWALQNFLPRVAQGGEAVPSAIFLHWTGGASAGQ